MTTEYAHISWQYASDKLFLNVTVIFSKNGKITPIYFEYEDYKYNIDRLINRNPWLVQKMGGLVLLIHAWLRLGGIWKENEKNTFFYYNHYFTLISFLFVCSIKCPSIILCFLYNLILQFIPNTFLIIFLDSSLNSSHRVLFFNGPIELFIMTIKFI